MSTFGITYSDYYRDGSSKRYFSVPAYDDSLDIGNADEMRAFIAECQAVLAAVESGNVDENGNYFPDDERWDD